jgi:protein-tyrosine phosphatase
MFRCPSWMRDLCRSTLVDGVMRGIARNILAGRVLLHCAAGLSRSPVMAAIYFDLVGFRSFDAALDEVARLRPIDPSPVIVRSAKEYLKMLVQTGRAVQVVERDPSK